MCALTNTNKHTYLSMWICGFIDCLILGGMSYFFSVFLNISNFLLDIPTLLCEVEDYSGGEVAHLAGRLESIFFF